MIYNLSANIDNLIGYKSGSIFIDMAFKKWLKKLLGETNYQKLDSAELVHKITSHSTESPQMRELMSSFDREKRLFEEGCEDVKIDLPKPLHNLNMNTRVVGGEITITKSVIIY